MEPAASHMGEISSSKTNQNVNKSILDVFSDLVAKAPAKRNETCITLVQHLAKSSTEDSVRFQRCVATRVYFDCICFYFTTIINTCH